MSNAVSFEEYREQWLEDVRAGNPSTAELGRRFAHKIFTQWRDISDPSDDLIYADGPGDGGIDLAYLDRGISDGDDTSGDTWYLVQSKYGTAFQGNTTLLQEGQKLINTLDNGQERMSEVASNLLSRVKQFLSKADAVERGDRLVLVYATEYGLSDAHKQALDAVRAVGRDRLGAVFDVEAVSIETIYLNTLDDPTADPVNPIRVQIEATMATSGEHLLVGSVPLLNLYAFLKAYRGQTENLDQLYEKNVRHFLGGRGRVNKGMQTTLKSDPSQFGLYNNGITFVVNDFKAVSHSTYELTEPYIVNGCQTTRTIWEVFRQKLESGGSGKDPALDAWQEKARHGVVVAKIVRVGSDNEHLLQNITRFTNSQNAVRDKDFVTLDEGFHRWKREMAEQHGIFLEVQRGGWDSQRALQKQNPRARQFTHYANGFDLLKVYGAGWMREAGRAFGRNAAFVPGGPLYRQIVEGGDDHPFGVDDLYAAYRIQEAADQYDFGRGSRKSSRRQTRYLFYLITLELLRDVLVRANMPSTPKDLTQATLRLFSSENKEAAKSLLDAAVDVVDEYLTQGEQDSVFNEPGFKQRNNDLNGFLKWDQLGKGEATPILTDLLASNKRTMRRGQPSPQDMIRAAIQ